MRSEATECWGGKTKENCMRKDKGVRDIARYGTKMVAAGSPGNVKYEAGSPGNLKYKAGEPSEGQIMEGRACLFLSHF